MRSDKDLQLGVVKALESQAGVNGAQIGVTAQHGIVTLIGRVGALREKWIAEKTARQIWGVRGIANELALEPDGASACNDTSIAGAAVNTLSWNSALPPDSIQVTVRDRWVTLTGTVPWQFQREAAETSVTHLCGVKGVTNAIAVKAPVRAEDVRHRIEEAFKGNAEVDATRVFVEAHDGTVVLKGTVHSLAERTAAENAAWAAPGVIAIHDQLVVAS